jgi:hypothetical protein
MIQTWSTTLELTIIPHVNPSRAWFMKSIFKHCETIIVSKPTFSTIILIRLSFHCCYCLFFFLALCELKLVCSFCKSLIWLQNDPHNIGATTPTYSTLHTVREIHLLNIISATTILAKKFTIRLCNNNISKNFTIRLCNNNISKNFTIRLCNNNISKNFTIRLIGSRMATFVWKLWLWVIVKYALSLRTHLPIGLDFLWVLRLILFWKGNNPCLFVCLFVF